MSIAEAGRVVKYVVKSVSVKAFVLPPRRETSRSISPFPSFPPPLNSMCSTQWVEPVMPGTSFREPIRYVTHVDRAFADGMGRRMTLRPLSRDSTRVFMDGAEREGPI